MGMDSKQFTEIDKKKTLLGTYYPFICFKRDSAMIEVCLSVVMSVTDSYGR